MKYFFPLIVLIMASCESNNCDETVSGDTLTVLEENKTHLSSYFDSEKVVFLNSATGEEVTFEITDKTNSTFEYTSIIECEEDPNETSPLKGIIEYRQIQINNAQLNLTITLQHLAALNTPANPNAEEQIFILEGELNTLQQIDSAKSGLLVVTPNRSDELFTVKTNSVIILGKEFLNVEEINPDNTGYDNDFVSPNLTIGYTANEGIIYIKDSMANYELVFESVE